MSSTFLTAQWRNLVLLNYEVPPVALRPLVPAGTEIDDFDGRTFISLVGFQFLNTRVLGVRIPGHRDFEEINLRFYVRRKSGGEWRRGVVFVKEFVPRRAIAWTARLLYGENYHAAKMAHRVRSNDDGSPTHVEYSWRTAGQDHAISLRISGPSQEIAPGSHEEFITEHYWGYVTRGSRTIEYRVDHPRWRVWSGSDAKLDCDVGRLYGRQFVDAMATPPFSALLADGSEVVVYQGEAITP
jgi:hypothetical protein